MRNATQNIHKAYILGTTPVKIEPQDYNRKGWILQNQANAGGSQIYISAGGSYPQDACLRLLDGENANEDILAPNQDLYAFAANAGDILTVILKY